MQLIQELWKKYGSKADKRLVLPAAALAVVGGVLTFGAVTQASMLTGQGSLAEKISKRFGIQQSEVEQVMQEHRQEMQQNHDAKQLVDQGKITAAQKDALMQKHKEMQENRKDEHEKMQGMTKEERQKEHEARRSAMDAWLKEQGIDKSVLQEFGQREGGERGMHKGPFREGGR